MTPAAALDKLLPRWRATLPPRYSPEYIDGFITRNRSALEAVVARAMLLRNVKRGAPPESAEAFALYGRLVQRERPKDADADKAIVHRLLARGEKMKARGRVEPHVALTVYVEVRAEAVLLREAGWDAVPLLLREPALAVVVGDEVVAVVDVLGVLHMAPGFDRTKQLRHDVTAARERVESLTRELAEPRLERFALALWSRVRAASAPRPAPVIATAPPDLRTKANRTEANLKAMRIVASKEPGELTSENMETLAQYSGWGGLSIESVKNMMPEGLVPETFGLVHEYYTPPQLAEELVRVICSLLPELAGSDGIVRALEPSAGTGRLLRSFTARLCLALEAGGQIKKIEWTAVEFSKVSAEVLHALRPDVDLYNMPFERWIREEGPRFRGTINFIVANPPFGERGAMAREDPDEFYAEKRAYAYFMRRSLDLLVPGGVGVFLVPAGFLSGNLARTQREKLLRRHHLLGAFRIPSHDLKGRETVPGASVVMDLLFWRSRGGELTEVDPADQYILEGDYFKSHPDHLLGREEGAYAGDDEAGMAKSWRYSVIGDFKELPPLVPRPLCRACVLTSIATREVGTFQTVTRGDDAIPGDVSVDFHPALELGRRVGRYLAAVGADDAEKSAQLWPELHAALEDFAESFGNPWASMPLRALAETRKLTAAQQLLGAFEKSGKLVVALQEAPKVTPKFTGQPDDVVAQAEALFRQQRSLTVPQLVEFHRAQGGTLESSAALAAVLAAEWNLDGDDLYPADAYLTGNDLWARHDRAAERAQAGDEQAKLQVRRLLDAIKPATFEDLTDVSPQHGYVPLDLVAGWISATINSRYGAVELERKGGFVQIRGHRYTDTEPPPIALETLSFLGFYNHDPEMFKPPQDKQERSSISLNRKDKAAIKQSIADRRIAQAKKWDESFRKWIAADEDRREQLVHAYNRIARGRIVPQYLPEPLDIARWGPQSPKLKPHQIAGARRVLANHGGGVFFDVGVGKTYTALAIIARARQEGWVRRPVILVPSSLVWKWHDDILCTLPDYRVAVIGSKRKRISRGVRKNVITSEPDTPQERAKKWTMLQTGQLDVVILSYDALARTKMNEEEVLAYVQQVEAVARSIALRKRGLEEKTQSAKAKSKLTERELALLEHGVQAWVEEILALPGDWEYDPGVAWDDIGIDMLIVDEAAAFKNLYKPQAREDGVPKFMGGGGEGSDRAWQLDFRAAAVRRKNKGTGVVLLTATPAKNSPLEFYNLIQFIDPTAFTKAGILDPEQFIDRFLRIEQRDVLDAAFEVTKRSAVVGFKNLDDLRTIIFTYGEFRTAAEVGLKLPEPIVIGPPDLMIKMDDVQEAKYTKYVAQIENILEHPDPEGGKGNVILGLLARLSLIALHPSLEDGYTYKTALEGGTVKKQTYVNGEPVDVTVHLPRPTYTSPKLAECAKRVVASPHCGHIIFCEPTAVHQWMREELVRVGIPRERIAILNAEETAPADRIRIAREFNGQSAEPPEPGTCTRPADSSVPPKYDVVIANSVAYEGVDMQVRTCTIHHLDLPWTPADLEQRNGRAVRYGNTLGTVNIFYYFADGSTDGYRFSLIDGKAGWLGELIKSQVRDTNNPAAQQQLTPEDILLMISRNKEKTRKLLEEKKRRQAEEARARVAKEAGRIFRQAAGRFRDARLSTDPEKAARLRDEGEQRLAELEHVNPEAWPWAPWMYAVRDTDVLVPENGGAPVYEGLRLARPRAGAPGEFDFLEFGQTLATEEGEKIGLRAAGSPSWQLNFYTGTLGGSPPTPADYPRESGPMWPDDDDTRTAAAIERKLEEATRYGTFETLGWRGASDVWLEKWWPRYAARIAEGLAASFHDTKAPVVDEEGLAIASGAEIRGSVVLPPTRAGWQQYLELAPKSGESYTALREMGLSWWDRKIPPNLLKDAKERAEDAEAPASSEEPERTNPTPTSKAPPPVEHGLSAEERAEEERMGEALRAERDREESEWADAVRRGTEAETAQGLGPAAARREALQNLGSDIKYYDRPERKEEAEWADAVRRGTEAEMGRGLGNAMARRAALQNLGRDIKHYDRPERPFEEARSAIKALGLPMKRYTYFMRQAEEAVADGKSYLPVVARAQKAAERAAKKDAASKGTNKTTAAPASQTISAITAAVDTFNAEPRWRAAVRRRLRDGRYILIVHSEGRDEEEAIASIDVDNYDVEEVRWLGDVPTKVQDEILERMERALWVAFEAENPPRDPDDKAEDDEEERVEVPSPIQGLIDMMERRNGALGSVKRSGVSRSGTDGFDQIAGALKDLAEPAGISADDLERWLESVQLLEAAEAVGRLRSGDPLPVRQVMTEIWGRVLAELPVVDVDGRPGELQVAPSAIFNGGGGDPSSPKGPMKYVLEHHRDGERYALRRIRIRVRDDGEGSGPPEYWVAAFKRLVDSYTEEAPEEAAGASGSDIAESLWKSWKSDRVVPEFDELESALENTYAPKHFRSLATNLVADLPDETVPIDDSTDRLRPGSQVHEGVREEAFLVELYNKLGSFHDDLLRAPRTLQDVRVLLYWTAAMLNAPLCQGEVQRRATAAFEQAKALYDKARQKLVDGQSVDAVRRLHAAMRRISTAAAEIARSCGEGQIDIGVTPPHLPVRPEDKAEVVGGAVDSRP